MSCIPGRLINFSISATRIWFFAADTDFRALSLVNTAVVGSCGFSD